MQALILAAGRGTRLRPLTDQYPKCLVSVHGKPILHYQLESLSDAGLEECVIVVGYRADQVRRAIGTRFGNLRITYVENEHYGHTNNIYSLWMARREISEELLLLEGDLIFEPELVRDLLEVPHEDVAVVDRFLPSMNGTVIQAKGDVAHAMVLKADQPDGFDHASALKTVNIYKLSRHAVREVLMPAVSDYVARGLVNYFYEIAFSRGIAAGSLQLNVLRTGRRWWTEIDTVEELREAEELPMLRAPLAAVRIRP